MRITLCVSTLLRSTGCTDVASSKFLQYFCGGIVLGICLKTRHCEDSACDDNYSTNLRYCILVGSCTVTHHRHAILAPCLSI